MSLGKRLKESRKYKDLTQEEAAKRLGTTFQALSNYERDYRDPDTALLKKMAELYDVDTDYLLGRTDVRNYEKEIIAAHRASGYYDEDLPSDVKEKIREYADLLREKYKKEKGGS